MNEGHIVGIPSDAVATIYRLDGKMDAVLARISSLEATEPRIRAVERRQSVLTGAGVLGGGLISTLIAILGILPK